MSGIVTAEVAVGEQLGDDKLAKRAFDARVIPSVAYTDPEIAWVGVTDDEARAQGLKLRKGLFPWAASGRAIANGRDEGFTELLFDEATHRIVGGGIVGTHAGAMTARSRWPSRWAPTRSTSAGRSTRTRRSANRSAWRRRRSTERLPTCHPRVDRRRNGHSQRI